MKYPCVLLAVPSLLCLRLVAAPGATDPSFGIGSGFNGTVNSVAAQTDGKLLVAGSFTMFNGQARTNIVRLQTTGEIDSAFQAVAINNAVEVIALQADGKVVLGGGFSEVNGASRPRLARLNGDGTLDTGFDPGGGFNGVVYAIGVQGDGKIVVGGSFNRYQGAVQSYLVRLAIDATVDGTFGIGTGPDSTVNDVVILGDGRVLLVGAFGQIGGTTWPRVARLLGSGLADSSFDPGQGPNGEVRTVVVQSDGKMVLGGTFTQVEDVSRNRIARLNGDGSLDPSFVPGTGANGTIEALDVQADGKILVGGSFTQFRGQTHNRIARLAANGDTDVYFNTGAGADATVNVIRVEPDQSILVGGAFTLFDGLQHPGLVRLPGGEGAPPTPLEFVSISIDGGTIDFELLGTPGQSYGIDATTDFDSWSQVASGTIPSSPFVVTITRQIRAVEFFRGVSGP